MNVPPDDLFDLSIPLVEIPRYNLSPHRIIRLQFEKRGFLIHERKGKLSEFIELNFGFLKFVFTFRAELGEGKARTWQVLVAHSRCRFTYKTVLFFLRNGARLRFHILHRSPGNVAGPQRYLIYARYSAIYRFSQ